MANHSLPQVSSTYTNFVLELNARIDDLSKMSNSGLAGVSNLPTGAIRWDTTALTWKTNTGTPAAPVWTTDLSSAYNININGTVGATNALAGTFSALTANTSATLPASTTVGGAAVVTASSTSTMTNKTLTSPIFSTIVNVGTLTLPIATDTLVGRATTDALSNKTLTSVRITASDGLFDTNGNRLLGTPALVTSAVNYLELRNSSATVAPAFAATGTDVNISINLVPKGTGTAQSNGIDLVTISATQTLSNKTLTSPIFSTIVNTGTLTLPTATDTLVGRATTDTLTNKTLGAGTVYTGTGASGTNWAIGITGTAAFANAINGGLVGQILYQSAVNTTAALANGSTGQLLQANAGNAPSWVTLSTLTAGAATNAANVGTTDDTTTNATYYVTYLTSNVGNNPIRVSSSKLTYNPSTGGLSASVFNGSLNGTANIASNIGAGSIGQVPYQTGANTTAFVAAGTAGYIFQANGATTPSWVAQATLSVGQAASCSGNALTSSSCSGNALTATTAVGLAAANWTVSEVTGVLYFRYGGVNKAKLDSAGNFTVIGNVTAYGTV